MKLSNSYFKLGKDFYKEQFPDIIKNPDLIIFNKKLASKLQLEVSPDEIVDIFSGNKLLKKTKPIALAYCGHQFGNFVPTLGDGRAVLLTEIEDKHNNLYDIQLKGSGRTYFSRSGDGKCPLDAGIREYLVSEAMHFLNIRTTRSLALINSDEIIQRENLVPASIITRIAASHIRIGTFEYFAAREDDKNLEKLAKYSLKRHYPKSLNKKTDNLYLELLRQVIKSQAELVASWMSIGFIHGVMNTDNTAISGQTIDYGPCAFMDQYQHDQCYSFIDRYGRYNYSNQRKIIHWNLVKCAESLLTLIDEDQRQAVYLAEKELNKFPQIFEKYYLKKMASKLGIFNHKTSDKLLINEFLNILEINKIDFTNGFRILSKILTSKAKFYDNSKDFNKWRKTWLERVKSQNLTIESIAEKMDKINPILIPRNHIIAEIISQAVDKNDFSKFHQYLKLLENPFTELKEFSNYYLPPTEKQIVPNTFCGT